MANIKSQIKRNKQNEKRRVRNRVERGSMRSTLSKARVVLATGAVEESKESVMVAISSLDRAVTKGILHKNNAARRKSRLMKRLAALAK